jgi:hypothetical protein
VSKLWSERGPIRPERYTISSFELADIDRGRHTWN